MTVKTRTAIPISFYLSDENENDRTSSPRHPQSLSWHTRPRTDSPALPVENSECLSSEVSAATSLLSLADSAPKQQDTLNSDTIVVANLNDYKQQQKPAVIRAVPCSEPAGADSVTQKKRVAAGNIYRARAPKRQRRTRAIPSNMVVKEPLTPPATPPAISVPSQIPLSRPPVQAHGPVNHLPPTSIVTKRNRVTQEFRNGVTSVQVPVGRREADRAEPAGESVVPQASVGATGDEASPRESPVRSPPPCTPTNPLSPQRLTGSCQDPESLNASFPAGQPMQSGRQGVSHVYGYGQPAVNWDCHTHVIQDQKVYTTYEKPNNMSSSAGLAGTAGTNLNNAAAGPNVNNPQPQAYNKMTTKTVTVTITTTIATTEILRPGEQGYEDALERHRRQSRLSAEEKEKLRREYEGSKVWASAEGARRLNTERHWVAHRGAEAGRMPNLSTRVDAGGSGAECEAHAAMGEVADACLCSRAGVQGGAKEGVPVVKEEERDVRVKVEVPDDATMDEVQEYVRIKMEEMED